MTDEGLFRSLGGRDPYEVLGVPSDATRDDIMRARRERQLEAHPDRSDGGADDSVSKLINNAATILGDERLRADYDRCRTGRSGGATPPPPTAEPSPWDAGTPGFGVPPAAPQRLGPFPPTGGHRWPQPASAASPAWAGPEMAGSAIPAGPMPMPTSGPQSRASGSGLPVPAIVVIIVLTVLVLCCGFGMCLPFGGR